MLNIPLLLQELKNSAHKTHRKEILGRNALIRDLFDYLFKRSGISHDFMFFYTERGLVLNCCLDGQSTDLAGCTIDPDLFKNLQKELVFISRPEGFQMVLPDSKENRNSAGQLLSNLKMLLSVFDANKDRQQFLLNCLDAADNAICIYDKNANLLYGNKSYFENMQIFDKETALGMNILDITRSLGIKIQAAKNGSNNLKMLDVLKSGRKTLDWEVVIESETSPNKAQFVSNNMYPVKNRSGRVDALIEIAYSHQLNLNKTKKIMGLTAEYTFDSIIGESPAITSVIAQAKEYAASPYNLLIVGESGVGKELFAQAIHNHSIRKHEPFVPLNCANFPEHLIESELFGYVGGAFTGASKNGQMGKFELADGGTLFLDEIGELPLHFQSKLLRVLETHKINRIGSSEQTPVNVRVLAATNRDLEKMIEEGLFRKDLYYRLQVLNILIPPLRQRRDDLMLLTETFFAQAAEVNGQPPKSLDKSAKQCLLEYDWPGNVRELKNVIQRVSLLSKTKRIDRRLLESAIYSKGYPLQSASKGSAEEKLQKCRSDVNQAYAALIKTALELSEGNKKQAAEILGVSRQTFYRMLEKYL